MWMIVSEVGELERRVVDQQEDALLDNASSLVFLVLMAHLLPSCRSGERVRDRGLATAVRRHFLDALTDAELDVIGPALERVLDRLPDNDG